MIQATLILLVILAGFKTSQSAFSNAFRLSAAAAPPAFKTAKTFAVNNALILQQASFAPSSQMVITPAVTSAMKPTVPKPAAIRPSTSPWNIISSSNENQEFALPPASAPPVTHYGLPNF